MKQYVFWQFSHMGLGSLWQEISFILSFQDSPVEIVTHLNDYYFTRLKTVLEDCFAPSRYPIELCRKEVIDYGDAYEWNDQNWNITSKEVAGRLASQFGYSIESIITYNCDKKHIYWPLKFKKNSLDNYVCFDFIYRDIYEKKPKHHYEHKDLSLDDYNKIVAFFMKHSIKYIDLNKGDMTIAETCEKISGASCYIGREGGWSHVAHSAKIPFYPVMYPLPRVKKGIEKAHQGMNPYLNQLISPDEFPIFFEKEFLLK